MDKKVNSCGEIRTNQQSSSFEEIAFGEIRTESSIYHFMGSAKTVYNFFERKSSRRCSIRFTSAKLKSDESSLLSDKRFCRGYTLNRLQDNNLDILSLQDLEILIFALGSVNTPVAIQGSV